MHVSPQDSLGGNTGTVMITTVRPSPAYFQQTLMSLTYAHRAKHICNRPSLNREIVGDCAIHEVSAEIERLRDRLQKRTDEFNSLMLKQQEETKENDALKQRLQVRQLKHLFTIYNLERHSRN
jgi:kinesin family protein 11